MKLMMEHVRHTARFLTLLAAVLVAWWVIETFWIIATIQVEGWIKPLFIVLSALGIVWGFVKYKII